MLNISSVFTQRRFVCLSNELKEFVFQLTCRIRLGRPCFIEYATLVNMVGLQKASVVRVVVYMSPVGISQFGIVRMSPSNFVTSFNDEREELSMQSTYHSA